MTLLAKAYRSFVETSPQFQYQKINPSGYQESQGEFTTRFSREMAQRLSLPCQYFLGDQTHFPEPRVRVNINPCSPQLLGWNEKDAWDELACYYQTQKASV